MTICHPFLLKKKGKRFMDEILRRFPDETEEETLFRIGSAKRDGLLDATWETIAEFMNETFRTDETEYRSESAYRKRYKCFIDAKEMFMKQEAANEQTADELSEKLRKIEKATVKLRDERSDYQRTVRAEARRESFLELVERSMAKSVEPFEYKTSPVIDSNEDMIVCLSDLHAGIEVQNWWNTYNTGVLKNRLHKYLDEIHSIQELHKCKVCNVVLGGDHVSGLIHQNLRLQNNENVIEQLKIAVTYIGEFIYALQDWFEEIKVFSVPGNHSRINPNKDEHLKGEELDELIPFCLTMQFAHNDKVEIADTTSRIDSTICAFRTRGDKLFYAVHGDKDAPSNVVKNLTLMSGLKPDGIIMGHRHHTALDTQHNVKVVQCGCTVGMDDYCVDKRISGEPEQSVIITSEKRAVKCLYDVGLI
jgi:metallophosphoesterase superfamily enzyme